MKLAHDGGKAERRTMIGDSSLRHAAISPGVRGDERATRSDGDGDNDLSGGGGGGGGG